MEAENKLIVEFKSEIISSTSFGSQSLGTANNEMELFINDDGAPNSIEWVIDYTDNKGEETGEGDVVEIGIWAKGKMITDYDGVFELPEQAIQLLKDNGFDLSEIE